MTHLLHVILVQVLDEHATLLPSVSCRSETLKLLQDISSSSAALPEEYTLRDVEQTEAIPVARGGEASIFRGLWAKDNTICNVVLRKIFLTQATSKVDVEKVSRQQSKLRS